jgi:hypothetical protein
MDQPQATSYFYTSVDDKRGKEKLVVNKRGALFKRYGSSRSYSRSIFRPGN